MMMPDAEARMTARLLARQRRQWLSLSAASARVGECEPESSERIAQCQARKANMLRRAREEDAR